MGKWQKLILQALEEHGCIWLTDLLERHYSLSDYNALTRACRTLVRQGKVRSWQDSGRLVISDGHVFEPVYIEPKVKSKNLNFMERYCWRNDRHPRIMWRSAEYVNALDYISSLTGISADALVSARTMSVTVTKFAANLAWGYPEGVVAVVKEAYESRRRYRRRIEFIKKIVEYVERVSGAS